MLTSTQHAQICYILKATELLLTRNTSSCFKMPPTTAAPAPISKHKNAVGHAGLWATMPFAKLKVVQDLLACLD